MFGVTPIPILKVAVYLPFVPDLAVEVRSRSIWRYDVGAKFALYERAALPELWLVDTEANTVLVFRRSSSAASSFDLSLEVGAGGTLTSPLPPEVALEIAELVNR